MGITCVLRRTSEAEFARLREEPEAIGELLFGPAPATGQQTGLRGFLGWLWRASAEPEPEIALPAPSLDARAEHELDIDKAWHGLHFLFTGMEEGGEEPACFLLVGGEEVSEPEDHEIGLDTPARALDASQVRRFADFLDALSPAELARRYDPLRMVELKIYPDVIWTRPPGKDEDGSPLEYLLDHFALLREFIAGIAARGDGLIIYQS